MTVLKNDILEIEPKISDIGDFEVRRFLPSALKRSVGPFIFFDEMGPTVLTHGQGMDVRPHPHIGLSTLTWLIEGEIVHRDSLGYVQTIRPGEVNWMTAGRGIVHSERSAHDGREGERALYGLQIWMALPSHLEEIDPDFQHVKRDDLPKINQDGVDITLIAGHAFGKASPVRVQSPTIYLDVRMKAGGKIQLPSDYDEQAVFIIKGRAKFGAKTYEQGSFLILPNAPVDVIADDDLHFVLLGGQALKTKRYMWWNFVSTRKERIEQAKRDWQEGRFAPVPQETDFIPLPAK